MGIETWTTRKTPLQKIKLWIIGETLDTNKQASSLFSKMLNSIELQPEDVSLKSNLSDNLIQELNTNPPQLLLAIGRVAIDYLLNKSQPLDILRGEIHKYHNTPLVVSHHPTDLLLNPIDKKQAWQDLLFIQQLLTQSAC